MGSKAFYISIISFGLGVLLRSYFDLGIHFLFLLGLVASILLLWRSFTSDAENVGYQITTLVIVLVSFSVGVLRFEVADYFDGGDELDALVGEEVSFVGTVSTEPKGKDSYRSIVLRVRDVSELSEKVDTKVLVFAPFYPEVSYGDEIEVRGELQKPDKFQTERGDIFDYGAYLSKDGIFYQIFFPEIEVFSSDGGNFLIRNLLALKSAFLGRVERVIPEPHAALLGGVLLGTEESLGESLIDDFRRTGLIHIVVLSGYNVTIVADFVRAIFAAFLPGFLAGWLGIAAIILFAIIVGFGATVVRASIMAILVIVARQSGRHYAVGRALLFAGALMVLVNPKILAFDASFQLSFLATLGLVYAMPVLEPYFWRVPARFGLKEIVLATLATQIFVLPFILFKMGLFSVVSLPVNILVLPVVPFVMLSGFITGLLGFLSEILSIPFAYISFAILEYVLMVVEWFAGFEFAAFEVGTFSFVWVLLAYALYTFLIQKFSGKEPEIEMRTNPDKNEAAKIAGEMEIVE